MAVLYWEKPAKSESVKNWKEGYGFEDGPTGGYIPNMSSADQARWKAKISGTKLGFPQVEIRKTAGCQMTIIVSLGEGYNYKHYRAIEERYEGKTPSSPDLSWWRGVTQAEIDERARPLKGINVHMALNGPAQMTFAEMAELNEAVAEAKGALERLVGIQV